MRPAGIGFRVGEQDEHQVSRHHRQHQPLGFGQQPHQPAGQLRLRAGVAGIGLGLARSSHNSGSGISRAKYGVRQDVAF